MKNIFMTIVVVAVMAATGTVVNAQPIDELGGEPQSETTYDQTQSSAPPTDPGPTLDQSSPNPPKWETREGVEVAAKAYFQAKQEYISCRGNRDRPGMRRASANMTAMSRKLDRLKKLQQERDRGQDARLDAHSKLVWQHESQINGKGGINDRLGNVEKGVGGLQKEIEAVTPAIAGIDGRFSGLTWWVLVLTLIVLVGFTRRFWISR